VTLPPVLSLLKSVIAAASISVATAVVFFGAFIAAAIWAPQDQQAIRQHMIDAVVSGELNAQVSLFQKYPVYRNVFNCLLFNMMLAPPRERAVEAISNRMTTAGRDILDERVPPFPDCQALWRALPELGGPGADFVQYDRYLIAMRPLGRVLLSAVSVESLRHIQVFTSYALLGLGGLLALYRFRRAPDAIARAHAAGYLAIVASLLLFFGVSYFDATLNFAPMDCAQFLFILLSLIWPPGAMRPAGLAFFAASYGCAIALFEFLTGGLPLALALLPLLIALGFRGDVSAYVARVIRAWGCFCIAAIAMFAIKKLYTIVFLGDTESFMTNLLYRTYGAMEADTIAEYTLVYLAMTYYSASAVIAWGLRHLGPLLEVAGFVAVLVVTWRSRKEPWSGRCVLLACWLSMSAIGIWFAVFMNHALLHSFYMARLLVIPIMAGAVVTATQIVLRRAARSPHNLRPSRPA
jgi:multisubunit Na+/H+ antiporter MnhG subunit